MASFGNAARTLLGHGGTLHTTAKTVQRVSDSAVCQNCRRNLFSSFHQASIYRLANSDGITHQHIQVRSMSQRKSVFHNLIENVREGLSKNTEMKESLSKFREERKKLEDSDALQKAKAKFEAIESETVKSKAQIQTAFSGLQKKVGETWEEAQKMDVVKKGRALGGEVAKGAGTVARDALKKGEQLGKTNVMKSVAQGVKAAKQEFDAATIPRSNHYKAPTKLKKRTDLAAFTQKERQVEVDEESKGIVMHKDYSWSQSWDNFKSSNPYVTKMFDLKTKYDESDNLAVRMTRTFTEKMRDVFGNVFSVTELSEVLSEIVKVDPSFDKETFTRFCREEIIPNALEALLQGDLEVLKDWCSEGAYNQVAHAIHEAKARGCILQSSVLDVGGVDVVAGKMMDQGPVLIITFTAQQINAVMDRTGKVIEGDLEKVMRYTYVWALCRDQEMLDPKAAWRVMEMSAHNAAEQWL